MTTHPDSAYLADQRGLIRACPQCQTRNRLVYAQIGKVFRCGSCKTELAPPDAPIDIPSTAVFDALIAATPIPVLVDFWAPWCGPCRKMAPELHSAARANAGHWLAVKVNTDVLTDLSARFQISGIPLLVVFQGGREAGRQAGAILAHDISALVRSFTTSRA